MPRGDGTGPEGLGSNTGKGLGYCTAHTTPGCGKAGGRALARGRGRMIGRGLGFRRPPLGPPLRRENPVWKKAEGDESKRGYYGEYTKEDEIEELKTYADHLKEELEIVEERLDELTE